MTNDFLFLFTFAYYLYSSMLNLKEHIKLTGVYTFFAAFPAILQLIVYPIIEGNDRLGAEDFGYLAITEAIISLATMFCLLGMNSAIARFFYDYNKSKTDYSKLLSTIFSGILIRGGIIIALFTIFSDFFGTFFTGTQLSTFGEYGYLLAISGTNRAILAVAIALYRQEKKLKSFVFLNFFAGLIRAILQVVFVVYFETSFLGYVIGTAIGGGIVTFLFILFVYFKNKFSYSKSISKALLVYSLPIFLSELLFWGLMFSDRFFLLSTPEALGIYDNAMKIAIGAQFIIQGLSGSIQPEIYRCLDNQNEETIGKLKQLSNLFIAETIILLCVIMIPAMLFVEFFFETQLVLSASIIPIIFARFILMSQYYTFAFPVLFSKKTTPFIFVNLVILALNISLNIYLVPLISYYGALISMISAYTIQVILFRMIQQRTNFIPWNSFKTFYFPLILIGLVSIIEIIKVSEGLNHYIGAAIFIFIAFTGLFLIFRKEITTIIHKHIPTLKKQRHE